ncbi:MAG: RNA polymerase sigma factor SigZ [Nitrospirae bacterium]|nr:RNA polymerase sigma factor SigZ [Nitrospirota bacterium]
MTPDMQDIWREVHVGLRVFIAKRVGNEAEADDIVQEVFLRAHRRIGSLKDSRRMVSWLFQIARHAIIDHYRTAARRREQPAGLAGDMETVHPVPAAPIIGEEAGSGRLRGELAGCLRPMIEALPTPYREAVTLVELEGLTQQTAAKQLGLSVSGMKSRVQRGRRLLKEMLDDCCLIQLDRRRRVMDYDVRDPQAAPCGSSWTQIPPRSQ